MLSHLPICLRILSWWKEAWPLALATFHFLIQVGFATSRVLFPLCFCNNGEVSVAVCESLQMQEPGFYHDINFKLMPKSNRQFIVLRNYVENNYTSLELMGHM